MTGHGLNEARRPVKTEQAERLASVVERLVNEAPPLSPAQRDRLALLLRPLGEVG